MGEEAEGILKPLPTSPGPFRDSLHLPKIFCQEGDNPIGFPVRNGMRYNGMCSEDRHRWGVPNPVISVRPVRDAVSLGCAMLQHNLGPSSMDPFILRGRRFLGLENFRSRRDSEIEQRARKGHIRLNVGKTGSGHISQSINDVGLDDIEGLFIHG